MNNNLEGDYVMELLVRSAKQRIKQLGPNHSSEAVNRIGQVAMFCNETRKRIDKQCGIGLSSGKHAQLDKSKDIQKIVGRLLETKVFVKVPGRSHDHFKMKSTDIFGNLDVKKLHAFINEKKRLYRSGKFAF